jgi:hypothetical protein
MEFLIIFVSILSFFALIGGTILVSKYVENRCSLGVALCLDLVLLSFWLAVIAAPLFI